MSAQTSGDASKKSTPMKLLYFDYNATHPPCIEIMQKNLQSWEENPANPSGISSSSQINQGRIEKSRARIAEILSANSPGLPDLSTKLKPSALHFVSTGTEALYQMVHTYARPGDRVLISNIEHSAMNAACEDYGLIVDRLAAGPNGLVDPAEAERLLKTNRYAFLSVLSLSNETGVILPMADMSKIARDAGVPFLSDCAQAAGKIKLDYSLFDAFTINGHKFGAGFIAALYSTKPVKPLFRGGLQEDEKRAGTENLFSILNAADCLAWQSEIHEEKNIRLAGFQKQIEETLVSQTGCIVAGAGAPRSTNTSFLIFPEQEDMDFLFMGLDQERIVVSTGSSCKSRTRQPSSVLMAMGRSREDAMRAVRITTGAFTTQDEVDAMLSAIVRIVGAIGRPKAPAQ